MDELKLLKDIDAWLTVLVDEYNILHKDYKLTILKDLKNRTSLLINNKKRKDERFGNRYMLMVQHKDSDFMPFFVSDEFGSLTSNSLKAKTFTQGKSIRDARSKFNKDYIITKILITR